MAKKKEGGNPVNTQISLTVKRSKEFLKHIIENNQFLQKNGKRPVSVEIVSDAGIGKTSIVQQVAEESGLQFVKINLAQIEELGDLVGFCFKEFEVCLKGEGFQEKCEWIPESALDQYLKLGYTFMNNSRMSYAAPEWISGKEEGGILLLDDAWRGDTRFVNAVMELISRQEYISWKLPKNWHVILTNNPNDGEYLVNEIDEAQRTRLISIGLKFDKECWAEYAESQSIDGRCINFLLLHPEVVMDPETGKIKKGCNPRSMETFFNSIGSIPDFADPKSLALIQMIGEGCIGPYATQMFITFIHNKLDKLVSPEFIMDKPFEVVKTALKELIGTMELKNYRADIASTLSTRVTNYSINYAKDNKIDKTYIDRIEGLILDQLFGADLSYRMAVSLHVSDTGKFKQLAMRQKLTKYIIS